VAVSGTELWTSVLAQALDEARGILRVGVPAKETAAFARRHVAQLEQDTFIVDIASGIVYAAPPARNLDQARAQLDAFRATACAMSGYAIAMHVPDDWRGALNVWGDAPVSLDVMRALKAKWDPRGVLNPGAFVL